MPRQKLRDKAAVDVVAAAGAVTDQQAQRPAAVKIHHRFGVDGNRPQQRCRSNANRSADHERFAQLTLLVGELVICWRAATGGRRTHQRAVKAR